MSMAEYRDFGALVNLNGTITGSIDNLPENEKKQYEVNNKHYTQVYAATHEGENYLPFMKRSFISFSYDGKNIEDFGLIVTFGSDRLSKAGSAPFEDKVTGLEIMNGQNYWNTHYKANNLSFTLSTDKMTQQQLDNFLHHFRAGRCAPLVLSEHPNREIIARVASAPEFNLLPFESPIEIILNGTTLKTSTTDYKGDITLEFVMDDPFWYAKKNMFGFFNNQSSIYYNRWDDANGISVEASQSKDALKIMMEDGVPFGDMVSSTMMFGDGTVAHTTNDQAYACIAWEVDPNNEVDNAKFDANYTEDANHKPLTNGYQKINGRKYIGGWIVGNNDTTGLGARIAGIYLSTGAGLTINDSQIGYFYYGGTAPSYPTIKFTITPVISNVTKYIVAPKNEYANTNGSYNKIIVKCQETQEFLFTTPSLYTAYNQAIKLLDDITAADSWSDVKDRIRDNVKHQVVRAWVVALITKIQSSNSSATPNGSSTQILNNMPRLFRDGSGNTYPASFSFNSKTGEAYGVFSYNTSPVLAYSSNTLSVSSATKVSNQRENVGDMVKSTYIILNERNYMTSDFKIEEWKEDSKSNSYCVYSDYGVDPPMTNFLIEYKYMYL